MHWSPASLCGCLLGGVYVPCIKFELVKSRGDPVQFEGSVNLQWIILKPCINRMPGGVIVGDSGLHHCCVPVVCVTSNCSSAINFADKRAKPETFLFLHFLDLALPFQVSFFRIVSTGPAANFCFSYRLLTPFVRNWSPNISLVLQPIFVFLIGY